ncbi:MAG: alanyl-tRNA editing protein [Candidatus Aenigmatarchaeota archaeon]
MTELLYQKDSYTKDTISKAISVDGRYIELDRSIFYPSSGGQLCDIGILDKKSSIFNVISVVKKDGKLLHETDRTGLSVGDMIICKIDWDRRYMMMRMHTAAHIISGVLNHAYGALITGNQLGMEKSRIDFSIEKMDKEVAQKIVDESNEVIKLNLDVTSYVIKRDQLDETMLKLAKGFPESMSEFRIVQIGDFDKQADGGTHVKKTGEIGMIKLIGVENKGKINRRIYFTLE